MNRSQITPGHAAKPAIALLLALALALSGCSGGDSSGESGSADAPQTSPAAGETTSGGSGETVMEDTSMGATSTTESTESTSTQEDTGGSTALSGGLEAAQREAESWNEDAELYSIAAVPAEPGVPPDVNAEGESGGWLYSFVSESAGSGLSVPYSGGEIRESQEQPLPRQGERAANNTLPVDRLVDSSGAMRQAQEVQSYLEENPEAGASAGVDSLSRGDPEWIISVPTAPEMMQERVPAVEQ